MRPIYSFGKDFCYQSAQYSFISKHIIINNNLIFVLKDNQIDILDEKYGNLKTKITLLGTHVSKIVSIGEKNEIFTYKRNTSFYSVSHRTVQFYFVSYIILIDGSTSLNVKQMKLRDYPLFYLNYLYTLV